MRIVFYVEEKIPELADPGDYIGLFLDGRDRPVVRYTEHPASAVARLTRHRSCLSAYDPPPRRLDRLLWMLGDRTAPSSQSPPDLQVVE